MARTRIATSPVKIDYAQNVELRKVTSPIKIKDAQSVEIRITRVIRVVILIRNPCDPGKAMASKQEVGSWLQLLELSLTLNILSLNAFSNKFWGLKVALYNSALEDCVFVAFYQKFN